MQPIAAVKPFATGNAFNDPDMATLGEAAAVRVGDSLGQQYATVSFLLAEGATVPDGPVSLRLAFPVRNESQDVTFFPLVRLQSMPVPLGEGMALLVVGACGPVEKPVPGEGPRAVVCERYQLSGNDVILV